MTPGEECEDGLDMAPGEECQDGLDKEGNEEECLSVHHRDPQNRHTNYEKY